jgi:quercetin dioxygenase-like cupin family protein
MALFSDGAGEPFIDLGGGVRRRIRLHLPELMVVEIAFEPGAVGALHSHPHVQTSYVEEGAFDVTIDGETRRLGKGGCYIVPPNAIHGVRALEKGVLIDVFAPRRDDFLDGPAES